MVIHYPPARLRRNSDRPTAITNVLIATSGSSHTGEIPLGTPTCSARSRRGRWALYPNGDQVVVWPGGALAGSPVEVARFDSGPLGGMERPCRLVAPHDRFIGAAAFLGPAFGRRRLRPQSQNASSIPPSVDELEAQRHRWPVRPILGRMTVA